MRYDEAWFAELEEKGILNAARRAELIRFPEGSQILVQDAGGGEVHTTVSHEILSSLAAKSKHIILTHARKEKQQLPESTSPWKNIEFAENGHVTAIGKKLALNHDIEKLETISACPLYARLSISGRLALAEQVEIKTWEQDHYILQEGDPSDGISYIVHKGLVKTFVGDKLVQILGRGNSIGERGALTMEARLASIVAYDKVQMLVLSPDVFRSFADRLGLDVVYKRAEWLWKHPIFMHLPWATLLDLALDFQPLYLPTGRLLFEYGKPGNECYLLISGEITLFNDELVQVGTFDNTGEFFGGRAVLFGTNRNTYACVSQESEIWALPAAALQRLQMLYPSVILHLRSVENKRHGHGPFISALDINDGKDKSEN
jgi:CRP-like cAMP-binding protein